MNEKLKPCPFCGGEAEVYRAPNTGGKGAVVACRECQCGTSPYSFSWDLGFEENKWLAIERWNMRVVNE